jgi:hypothetical protein
MSDIVENIFDRLIKIHCELESLLHLLDTAIQENKFAEVKHETKT